MVSSAVLPQLQRALNLHQYGRAGEAWTILAPLRQAIDNDGQGLRLYALIAHGAGRIDEAVSAMERIAGLERDPPEIIGALADMLGSAGRQDEALVFWDRLVMRHPELADAHVNRAVTAAEIGEDDRAIQAADAGLKRFPGHARLMAIKAMGLKNVGRIPESVVLFEKAVAADPGRALTRHNQAVALRAACRFEEACEAFSASERLGRHDAQLYANWAAATLEAGRVEDAAELYRRSLAQDPAHPESLKALTRLQIEFRGGRDAFVHYESAARSGGRASDWLAWIEALTLNRRYEEAAERAREAPAPIAADPNIRAAGAFAEGVGGDALRALEAYDALPDSIRDAPANVIGRAQIALRAGLPAMAADLAFEFSKDLPHDQLGWTILSLAWRLLDDPREHWLCDYDRLVMVTEVPAVDDFMPADVYARHVASALDPLHQSLTEPGDQSLRHGTQTSGELFGNPDPAIQRFRASVMHAAEAAIADLPFDQEHPFLSRKSRKLKTTGSWSVRLASGDGYHVPHFHALGWMSSAYYARLPKADAAARQRHEGWIQFGSPPAMFNLDLEPRRIVEPGPGRLVLFPSYMWHGTVPFRAGDRLTAAFDFQPL